MVLMSSLKAYFTVCTYNVLTFNHKTSSNAYILFLYWQESKRAYVIPAKVQCLHQTYWKDGKVQKKIWISH